MGKTVRPLLLNKTPEEVDSFIREQLELREPHYNRAKHTVDVSLMDNYDKIKITIAKLKKTLRVE